MGAEQEVINVVIQPSKRELAGKYLGQNLSRIEKRRQKYSCFCWNWYHKFFYDGRPDVGQKKTRKEHWKKLHSSQRFISALFCYFGPPGHFLRNLKLPLAMVTIVGLASCTYYGMKYTKSPYLPDFDQAGNLKTLFQMGSFAVALLLALRINRTYERWWLARQSFGGISLAATQAGHWMAVWCDDEALVQKFTNWLIIYHFAVLKLVLALPKLPHTATPFLTPEERAVVDSVEKPRELAALQASNLLDQANLSVDKNLIIGELINAVATNGGTCVRIKFQAMPYTITLISTGFVLIWLLFLPLGLFQDVTVRPDNTAAEIVMQFVIMLIAYLFLALLLLSCDEIANQLEDPFYQLPLDEIVKNTSDQMQRTVRYLKLLREANAQEVVRLEKPAAE
jgi:putative membrane protein